MNWGELEKILRGLVEPKPRTYERGPKISQEKLREFVAKRKFGPAVAERILRLNGDTCEGERLRGLHRAPTVRNSINMDVVTRRHFDEKWGRGASRRLPREAFVNGGGKRRWISGLALMQGPPA